ncbi:UNVERIFIED_ORG: hypothetical protein QQG_2258 [Clostridioides difficile Y384]
MIMQKLMTRSNGSRYSMGGYEEIPAWIMQGYGTMAKKYRAIKRIWSR